MESTALKAAIVLPVLLLQKLSNNPKTKVLSACLETWLNGDLNDLLFEGRTIQQHIHKSSPKDNQQRLLRTFANLMFQGKTKAALRLLTKQVKCGVVHLGDHVDEWRTVRDVLIEKHPRVNLSIPIQSSMKSPQTFIPFCSNQLMVL